MIFHIQYYLHTHAEQTLREAAEHSAENSILQIVLLSALAAGIVFAIIKTRPKVHAKKETK